MNKTLADRRRILSTVPLALAGTLAGCATPAASARKPSTFVLVHGAWHGSWCYRRVADMLRARGDNVYTVTLTGLGERSHLISPDIRLKTHIDDVVNLVKWEGLDQIVLCGHSYGGLVVTGAAELLEPRIKAMVYLDAFIPASGQSLFDLSGPESRSRSQASAAKSGGAYIDPIPSKAFMVNEADQAMVDAKCTKQPFATFSDPVPSATAYERVRTKYYARAAKYASPPFDAVMAKLKPDWVVTRLPGGHDLMLDCPSETADFLSRAAAA